MFVFHAGAFGGSLIMYPVGELLGRKIGLIFSGFLLTFGAAITLIANEDIGLGAIITGIGIAGSSGLAPFYISEISQINRLLGVIVANKWYRRILDLRCHRKHFQLQEAVAYSFFHPINSFSFILDRYIHYS